MKIIRKSISIVMLLSLLSVFALNVAADPDSVYPTIDTGRKVTLTLQYHYDNKPIEGAVFNIYRVADVTKAGGFRFISPFSDVYDPEDEWFTVIDKMLQHADIKNEEPVQTRTTDSNGVATFASVEGKPLKTGLYLVEGVPLQFENEDEYRATRFLVMLPRFKGEKHSGQLDPWEYNVVVAPKPSFLTNGYTIYFHDNRESINNAVVTGLPDPPVWTFKRNDENLHHYEEQQEYVVPGRSGDNTDKNSYTLPRNIVPQAEGYTFVGWNLDPTATKGYSTIPFDPDDRTYQVYAIWKANEELPTSSVNPSSEVPSDEEPSGEESSSKTPSDESSSNVPSDDPSSSKTPSDDPSSSKTPSDDPSSSKTPSDDPSSSKAPSDDPASADPVSSGKDGGNIKKDPILPQTGMLWWPVPVLAILGFALFMLGVFIGKKNSSKKNRSQSGAMLIVGIICVSSALCLVLYNGWDDMRAGSDASNECATIMRILPGPDDKTDNRLESKKNTPITVTEMPTKRVQNADFSAVLSIPSLSLELPVRDTWSYPGLRRSPCRFTGSAYTDDLVICGHNYGAHFGKLKNLTKGSEIVVTAMNGDVFSYKVEKVTELSGYAYNEMIDSEYDLTLFTCSIGGSKRVTVRCSLTSFIPHDPRNISSEYIFF